MAIFGNVTDMPLPDVLSMVGRSTGRFLVSNTPEHHLYELHLDRGMLSAMIVDHDPVEDIFQVRNRMVELMHLRTGDFEFEKQGVALLVNQFNLPIDMLLLSSLAALDEMEAYRPHLPNGQTIFQVLPSKEAWLEGDLLEFWESSQDMLAEGTSADKIVEQTGLFLDHVLLCLYKLRTAGIIAPIRAFTKESQPLFPGETSSTLFRATSKIPDLEKLVAGQKTGPLPIDTIPEVEVNPADLYRPKPTTLQKILLRLRESFRDQV